MWEGPVSETLEHVSLPEAVGKALRRRILNNELPAETRLVEANLAAEFGVSRGTIRDAMRSLHAEGLIAIVPRRYSVVTRMSHADAEDVCFARYVLEDGSVQAGFGSGRKELARALRVAMQHMSAAAVTDDMDALVEGDTRFHELLIDLSEAVHRHRPIVEAVEEGDLDRLRAEIRNHYLIGFPIQ
jgi:DNA-binding GntR family transcriptional regulator